jgi:hypothetical protein
MFDDTQLQQVARDTGLRCRDAGAFEHGAQVRLRANGFRPYQTQYRLLPFLLIHMQASCINNA